MLPLQEEMEVGYARMVSLSVDPPQRSALAGGPLRGRRHARGGARARRGTGEDCMIDVVVCP
jgi:hypothetical protein